MRKTALLVVAIFATFAFAQAQSVEELTQQRDEKAAELGTVSGELAALQAKVDALTAEVADLTNQITPYPRWSKGLAGTLGLNFSGANNWLANADPDVTSTALGFTANAFANMEQEKYFWNNGANLALANLKLNDDDAQVTANAFNLTSLFGYNLSDKLALSALGEYRTTVLNNFNNPGYLDLGAGLTWKPITNLVVVAHPLNYNFVFAEEGSNFQSSLGAKLVADYFANITKDIAWKSNFSAFISYGADVDGVKFSSSDLTNWTWINGITTAYKGIGIGFDLGLRSNKQEALAAQLDDNPLQVYYVVGLTYSLAK